MSLSTLIQSGFSHLFNNIIIETLSEASLEKAISILKTHFTFTADEMTKAYQDSYGYAITAIRVGLATPDQKLAFVRQLRHAKVTREFADPIDSNYLQPFAQQRNLSKQELPVLRQQLVIALDQMLKQKDQLFQVKSITDTDLAALIHHQGASAVSQLVLDEIQQLTTIDKDLVAFLTQQDLLGQALLFFFHEQLRQDERLYKTQAALQREGLAIEVKNLQTVLKNDSG